ncbi:MFS transporter [Aminipila luticellarii]|uniref:MFS transporter n=1 Tax=Aminipila luticellarii TaxID=2507160 RepID=A0A410PUY6_9FIRM|nr:MFS transporter [Aminipila luticellarii]QAT42724.1 MFS transporter [Aminipila luticellarii]
MNETLEKNPQRWKVLFGGFACYTFDSFDLSLLAMSLAMIIKDLHISIEKGGLLSTITLLGIGLSSFFIGWMADNYGRRKTLLFSLTSFGILTALIYVAQSWAAIMILRFLAGFGLGGLWAVLSTYINETWAPHLRGRAASFTLSSFPVGSGFASFLAGILIPAYGWRVLFLTGALAIIPALYMYFAVPESKEWEESKKANKQQAVKLEQKASISEIFSAPFRKNTIIATIVSAFAFSGYWGASTWLPTLLVTEKGLDTATMAKFMVILNVGMFIGMNVFGVIADKLGKKKALMITFIGLTVTLPIYLSATAPNMLLFLGPVYAFFVSFTTIFGSYFPEMYPTEVRATGAGFCFNFGRGLSAIAPFILSVVAAKYSLTIGLGICSVFFFLSFVGMIFLPGRGQQNA